MKIQKALSVDKDVYKHIKSRDGFNASIYFCEKYRCDFMNLEAKKDKLKLLNEKVKALQNEIQSEELLFEGKDKKFLNGGKCFICHAFMHEGNEVRQRNPCKIPNTKVHVCRECFRSRPDDVKKIMNREPPWDKQ